MRAGVVVTTPSNNNMMRLDLNALALALLLWFVPYLPVVPLIFLLLAGGLSTTVHAVRQLWRFRRRKRSGKTNQSG